MNTKSELLNGYIIEEMYVHQPPGFENHKNHDFFVNIRNPCMV